jgi:hypothetical protein
VPALPPRPHRGADVPAMRRVALHALLLALVGLVLAIGAPGAQGAPRANGVIRGRVINESTGRPQQGVEITLTRSRPEGSKTRQQVQQTDARGRYRFEGLATGPDHIYALDGRFEGGLFAGRALTIPAQSAPPPVIDSTLRVWSTTADETSIVVERDHLFVRPFEGGLSVIESATIANSSARAYIGRGGGAGSAQRGSPTLGFALPAEAACRPGECGIVDSTIDVPAIVRQDYGFAATVAIPPGRTQITFSYRIEGSGGTFELSRVALYPTAETSIYATEPLEIRSERLKPDGQRSIGGDRYRVWSTVEGLDAGDSLPALAVAEGGSATGLVLGLGAGAVVAAGAVAVALARRSRGRPEARRESEAVAPRRDELLRAIAELDLRFEAGELSRATWDQRRTELKARLAQAPAEEAAPTAPR